MAKKVKQQAAYKYNAIVTHVIDGDTVELQIDLGFSVLVNCTCRLYGIDTPELKSKDKKQKELAISAKNYLNEKLIHKTVVAETFISKKDKYGRYLANIYLDNVLINKELIKLGYAKEFMI